jgi:hypothetical protein
MMRLQPSDLTEPSALMRLAEAAEMPPDAVKERFSSIFERDVLVNTKRRAGG